MILALVDQRTAVELVSFALFALILLHLWLRLDKKQKARVIARKERQAEYALKRLRAEREREQALRYFGGMR